MEKATRPQASARCDVSRAQRVPAQSSERRDQVTRAAAEPQPDCEVETPASARELVGHSPGIIAVMKTVARVAATLEALIQDAAPPGASVELELLAGSDAAHVSPDSPAIQLGVKAFQRAVGVAPRLVRTGGSLPLASALGRRGVPAVITGFDLPVGNIHAPDERFLLENIELGLGAARELFVAYAGLR